LLVPHLVSRSWFMVDRISSYNVMQLHTSGHAA
jgi:hypothetical protein